MEVACEWGFILVLVMGRERECVNATSFSPYLPFVVFVFETRTILVAGFGLNTL